MLVLAIFFNIISLNISPALVYFIMGLYFLLTFLSKCSYLNIGSGLVVYFFYLICIIFLVFIYNIYVYDFNNFYHIQFFGGMQVSFLLFYVFSVGKADFFVKKYYQILNFYIIAVVFSIIVDYIFLHSGYINFQLMYRDDKWSYMDRPFGIFGSPSVNSGLLVFFYILWLDQKNISFEYRAVLFFLVTLAILLQGSGTGYILYFIMMANYLYKKILIRIFALPLFLVAIWVVIQGNFFQKVSLDYIVYNYEYNMEILIMALAHFNSIWDILFGMDGSIFIPIDFGPLFFISKVGLIFFISYTSFLIYVMFRVKNRSFRVSVIALFVGGIHYPIAFSPVMNVFFPLVIFKYLQEEI